MRRLSIPLLTLAIGLCAALPGLCTRPAVADGPAPHRHRASITEGLDCGLCHTPAGWKTLSDGQARGFDHARTGFPLSGRHTHVACSGCHSAGVQLTRQCNGCHRDAHQGRLGQACDTCHSAQSFQRVDGFERHRLTRLPLSGMHALADCTDCHRRTTDRQWSSVPADCFACHEEEYRRSDIHPRHTGGTGNPPTQPFPRDCAQCHRASGWTPAVISPEQLRRTIGASVLGLSVEPERHELLFPIRHGAHRGAGCESCHTSPVAAQAVRCSGCHAHNTAALRVQHKSAPAVPSDGSCLSCHPGGARR